MSTLSFMAAGAPSLWADWWLWYIQVSRHTAACPGKSCCVSCVASWLCVCRLLQRRPQQVSLRAQTKVQSLRGWRGGRFLLLWGSVRGPPTGGASARQDLPLQLWGWRQGRHWGSLAGGESPEQVGWVTWTGVGAVVFYNNFLFWCVQVHVDQQAQ